MSQIDKPKLNISEQIQKLRAKGIKFEIFTEQEAFKFLQQNNYLFKVKSYCNTYKVKDNNGKTLRYENLDFAYLIDLSRIDMHLRRFILRLTLDIEHILKTKIMRDFNISKSDGYDIVRDFLSQNPYTDTFLDKQIRKSKKNPTTPAHFILKRYEKDLAIWNFIEVIQFGNFIEVIQFGNFIDFAKFFYEKYPNKTFKKIQDRLFNIKYLRNSCAHNNCILANLKNNINNPQIQTADEIRNAKIFHDLTNGQILNQLKNQTINDFVTSLFVYDKICQSNQMKCYCYNELFALFIKRFAKNRSYYRGNKLLSQRFIFCLKIIWHFKSQQNLNNKAI